MVYQVLVKEGKKDDLTILLLKISKSLRNVHDLDPNPFFPSADPGSGSASKLK